MKKLYVKIINCLATSFYVGYLPKAPGTWGSLLAVLIYVGAMNVRGFGGLIWSYHWFLLILFPVSIFVSGEYDRLHKKQDAAEIVIDEVVGQTLTFLLALWLSSLLVLWLSSVFVDRLTNPVLFLPNLAFLGTQNPQDKTMLLSGCSITLLGFALFRFFDIVKPLGIRQVQKLPRGWGVVLDDVLAGVYAALVLTGLFLLLAWI